MQYDNIKMVLKNKKVFERHIFLAVIFLLFVSLFAYRTSLFSDVEPRSDQAFFAWWVQGLVQADHIFPEARPNESFLAALERDDRSFAHRLLRPIHGKSVAIFTMVPLLIRTISTWFFGLGLEVLTISSIFAGTLIVLAIGLLPFWSFQPRTGLLTNCEINFIAFFGALFVAITYYLHYFSPLGNHNFGVLFLVISVAASGRAIAALEGSQRSYFIIGIAVFSQLVALYTHWTNVFLLPTATAFAWVFSSVPLRKKVIGLVGYGGVLFVFALPFLVFVVNDLRAPGNDGNETFPGLLSIAFDHGLLEFIRGMAVRAVQWVEHLSLIFSAPGLGLGLLGVSMLAWRKRIVLPLGICVIHFLTSVIIAIFGTTYMRTGLYILPFLALGMAYMGVLILSGLRNYLHLKIGSVRVALGTILLALMANHSWQQMEKIASPLEVERQMPHFSATYFHGQGEIRPVAMKIDDILPDHVVLFTWGYGMQFFVRNYAIERPGRQIMPTLLTLQSRGITGTLPRLIKRRSLSFSECAPIYALIDHAIDNADEDQLHQAVAQVLGSTGFALVGTVRLERKFRQSLTSSWPRDIALYKIHLE